MCSNLLVEYSIVFNTTTRLICISELMLLSYLTSTPSNNFLLNLMNSRLDEYLKQCCICVIKRARQDESNNVTAGCSFSEAKSIK